MLKKPAIPSNEPDKKNIQAIREALEVIMGRRGDKMAHVSTIFTQNDLRIKINQIIALLQDNPVVVDAGGIAVTSGYTVATLPTGRIGMRAYVTDATTPTYLGALTGGGSVICPIFFNGLAWVSA